MRTTLALFCLAAGVQAAYHCQRGESCWPTEKELQKLRTNLDPDMARTLVTPEGGPYAGPNVAYIETLSDAENSQPLYGLGLSQMEPLYVRENVTSTCQDRHLYESGFCKGQTTNVYDNVDPDFVVFPLNGDHVQTIVKFAKKHHLCIAVAGTGHEFSGRNQPLHCSGGSMLVRTTLMRSKETDFDDEAGLGHASFRFGAGNTFSDLHNFTSSTGKMIASGICPSVGIVGWSLGGGHGPYSPALGLGADQLLAVDIVIASGKYIRATATNKYSDLFRALRGGGGSTWGIITHVVVKAHDLPENGFTMTIGLVQTYLTNSVAIDKFATNMINYSLQATANISSMVLNVGKAPYFIGVAYGLSRGNSSTPEAQSYAAAITAAGATPIVYKLANPYAVSKVNISDNALKPWTRQYHSTALLTASQLPALISQAKAALAACTDYCTELWVSTLTGHVGSPQAGFNSISNEMRTALGMYMSTSHAQADTEANLGAGRVYLSESYPDLPLSRYWDDDTYARLLFTKLQYDSDNVFGCRHCVGDYY